jgi:hypothetical protein
VRQANFLFYLNIPIYIYIYIYRVRQANFLFYMNIPIWNAIWKRKLACRTLYNKVGLVVTVDGWCYKPVEQDSSWHVLVGTLCFWRLLSSVIYCHVVCWKSADIWRNVSPLVPMNKHGEKPTWKQVISRESESVWECLLPSCWLLLGVFFNHEDAGNRFLLNIC